jgi:type II secretory pathway predicted ATPase ExeA
MYEEFYGLSEKPFSIQPDPSFLYWGRGHRLAYAMLEYGVVNQAGISVVTGEVGCGKTTLIHRLLDQLSDTHTVALLSNIQAGRGDLLSWVLMGYGEPYAGKTHVEMFAQLQAFFIREYAKGKRVVLIIDEAQNLSVDMLEELRMLSNINAGKDQLLQLILVGQPQLKDLLSRPDMLQLAQRIGSDFHLTPLSREEVHAYVETRLTIAGASANIFAPEAIDVIAEQSRGVPRVINIIADTSLVYAFSANEHFVTGEIARTVIRDKLDYGVFGIANSPDLKLAEGRDSRGSGFLREAPRQTQSKAPPARVVANHGVKLAAPEEPAYIAAQPIGGPSLYETNVAAPRAAPAAPPPSATQQSRPAQAAARSPEKNIERGAAPAAAASRIEEIGVVIVDAGGSVVDSALSAPEHSPVVVVAIAGSEAAAASREAALDLVELDATSANGGRARNAGYRRLKKIAPHLKYVMFLQSGVLIDPDWFDFASRFMARRPEVAALEGKTIEAAAPSSIFQRLAGRDFEGSEGERQSTGQSALFRADAFEAAGGFRGDIIADETADLCIRLRRRGAHVWRSEEAMVLVEQRALSFADWRKKAKQNGFDYAAGAALHGGPPERFRASEQARAVMWGGLIPLLIFVGAVIAAVAAGVFSFGGSALAAGVSVLAIGFLLYALKIAGSALALGPAKGESWLMASAATLAHFYECGGVAKYWFGERKNANDRKAAA